MRGCYNQAGAAPVRFPVRSQTPSVATRVSVFFRGFIAKITLTLLADSARFPSNFRAGVADSVGAPPRPSRLRFEFFQQSQTPSLATRVSVFFRGFIAKITLTLLADSERFPSNFRAGVADSIGAQPRPSRLRFGFFQQSQTPSLATRVSVFFRGFIAKITLTLLADSERFPSNFRA
ncbi:MAG: hypothetical protein ACI9ZF_000999, partial [Bradyrhizobium sp.]